MVFKFVKFVFAVVFVLLSILFFNSVATELIGMKSGISTWKGWGMIKK